MSDYLLPFELAGMTLLLWPRGRGVSCTEARAMNGTLIQTLGLTSGHPVGLRIYLLAAAVLFVLGLVACMARRNAIGILIGIELILNAAILNFMAFWHYGGGLEADPSLSGPMMGIFIIILAACEAPLHWLFS